ncbi:MAG TPA: 3-dehydroquinate synthase [Verrucomicrobiales bacterium]|nr:3-dehydroquinate synthase [Verrucomicrobiales bacterium]
MAVELEPNECKRVPVLAGSGAYEVVIGPGLLDQVGARARHEGLKGRCAVITDSTVAELYGARCLESLRAAGILAELFAVAAGEGSKSMECAGDLCRRMLRAGLDRRSFVVVLGGGVPGDLGGFVAGIFQRGLPLVQAPTTVVAQVDSSVGGKTGVNAPEGKNLIGVFHQPRLVLADTDLLRTLPAREWNEGFAEVIKHAAIRDASLLDLVEKLGGASDEVVPELIERNVSIKAAVVAADEREISGVRALLNFGHTVGHAIEAAGGYGRFLHGEAISLGLRAALSLSVDKAGLGRVAARRVLAALRRFSLPTILPEDVATREVMLYLERDKKFQDGKVRFVLLRALGDAFVSEAVTREDVEAAVDCLRRPESGGR